MALRHLQDARHTASGLVRQLRVIAASVHDAYRRVGDALGVHTDTRLHHDVHNVGQRFGLLTVAQLLKHGHQVAGQRHVLAGVGRVAFTRQQHAAGLAQHVAARKAFQPTEGGVRPHVFPKIVLRPVIIAEQQVRQIGTQVPCKLHDVAECRYTQRVFQHLPPELALCARRCSGLVYAVTLQLLLHKLDARRTLAWSEAAFQIA